MKHKYMPVSISMEGRNCLVVGGGAVALRKVENLLDYDCRVTVIAPELEDKLVYHAEKGRISVENREYASPEAGSYGLVISATDESELNKQVYNDAQAGGAVVNVVDDPPHCDFIFPAVLRRNCLTTAISTDGHAPFMAGHLRMVLENIFPSHWDHLMKMASDFRGMVQTMWADHPEKKNICYTAFLEADWKAILKEMSEEELKTELERMLQLPA